MTLVSVGVLPRTARAAPEFVYHVLKRSVGRMHLFRKGTDFEAFVRVVVETGGITVVSSLF